jgi:hypothetical protein
MNNDDKNKFVSNDPMFDQHLKFIKLKNIKSVQNSNKCSHENSQRE